MATPYCGSWLIETGLFPRRDRHGGALALFEGREAVFAFKTRVAIRKAVDILGLTAGDEVLAPAYNCGSELDPLFHAGLKIRLYPVPRSTEVDPDEIEAMIGPETRAIYVTHYFGFLQPNLAALRDLCDRHGLFLLEDCALSLLSGAVPAEGRTGDVAFFCFYKFFPVIEGGALVLNHAFPGDRRMTRPPPLAGTSRTLLRHGARRAIGVGTIDRLRKIRGKGRDDSTSVTSAVSGSLPDTPGNYYFDPDLCDRRISGLTLRALQGQDIARAIRQRRENYLELAHLIGKMAGVTLLWPDLPAATCPLNLPILIPNRDAVARCLVREGIAATPWWSGYNRHLDWEGVRDARFLKNNVLSLPIHHQLGRRHIQHIASRLLHVLNTI